MAQYQVEVTERGSEIEVSLLEVDGGRVVWQRRRPVGWNVSEEFAAQAAASLIGEAERELNRAESIRARALELRAEADRTGPAGLTGLAARLHGGQR